MTWREWGWRWGWRPMRKTLCQHRNESMWWLLTWICEKSLMFWKHVLWESGMWKMPFMLPAEKTGWTQVTFISKENSGRDELERKGQSRCCFFFLESGLFWCSVGLADRASEWLYPGHGWYIILRSLRALSIQSRFWSWSWKHLKPGG